MNCFWILSSVLRALSSAIWLEGLRSGTSMENWTSGLESFPLMSIPQFTVRRPLPEEDSAESEVMRLSRLALVM